MPKYYDDRDPGEIGMNGAKRGSVTEDEEMILSFVFRGMDRVLEIGTGLGASTRAIAKSVREVVTCDIDPFVVETISKELPPNAVFVTDIAGTGPFDGAFIDGNHSEQSVYSDTMRVLPLLKPDAPIVFHDIHLPGVIPGINRSGLKVWGFFATKLPMALCFKP